MNKKIILLAMLFTASAIFIGCDSDDPTPDPEPTPNIVVSSLTTLNQTVYADDETGESTVGFTTLAPWTSSINELRTLGIGRNVTDSWISISPDRGDADNHEIIINLEQNMTGENRTAVISIISDEYTVEIRIMQFSTTRDGQLLLPPTPDPGVVINGVRWATDDVAFPRTFPVLGSNPRRHFQWNSRLCTWQRGWTGGTADEWEAENDPCPEGWRVPYRSEFESLGEGRWLPHGDSRWPGIVFGTAPDTIVFNASGILLPLSGHSYPASLAARQWHVMRWTRERCSQQHFAARIFVPNNNNLVDYVATGILVRCVAED